MSQKQSESSLRKEDHSAHVWKPSEIESLEKNNPVVTNKLSFRESPMFFKETSFKTLEYKIHSYLSFNGNYWIF